MHYTRRMAEPSKDPQDAAHWGAVEEVAELLQEERYADALVALREILRIEPKNPYAFHYLGLAFFETAQREAARDAYRAALRLAPNYLGARVALSHVLRILGDIDGALREAKEAARRFPKDPDAMHAAGLAHAARGDRAAARRNLEGFLGSNPEFEVATEVRGILEMLGIGGEDEPLEIK